MLPSSTIPEFLSLPENLEIALDVAERLQAGLNPNDPIDSFLIQPDQHQVAIKISHQVAVIKDQLHARFWPLVYTELQRRLKQHPQFDQWTISEPDKNHKRDWVQVHIEPKSIDCDHDFLEICFEQNTPRGGGYSLYFGVRWTNQNQSQSRLNSEAFKKLKAFLIENGYKPADRFWIHIVQTNIKVGDPYFVKNMLQQESEFIEEMVDGPWAFFLLLVDLLEAVNTNTKQSIL